MITYREYCKRLNEYRSCDSDVVNGHRVYDLLNDKDTEKYFASYSEGYGKELVGEFNKWLKTHKEDYVRLYHGTGARHDILGKGILKTTMRRRNSIQSESGYVYLTVYPDTARTFGELGNPYDKVKVYSVVVKIKELKPDTDQLKNKRLWNADMSELGDTLADSLIYGSGARVKRNIMPYEITPWKTGCTEKDNAMITFKEYCKTIKEDWGKTSPIPKEVYDFPDKIVVYDKKELKALIEERIERDGNTADLNDIDVSRITNMGELFSHSEFNGDISKWDVSKVKNMSCMFRYSKFNGDISKWDVSNVENMEGMFEGSEFNGDISKWNVSKTEDMRYMFYSSRFNRDISKWDVSNVRDMNRMFYNSKFDGDISKWDVSNVKDMFGIFFDSPLRNNPPKWYKG